MFLLLISCIVGVATCFVLKEYFCNFDVHYSSSPLNLRIIEKIHEGQSNYIPMSSFTQLGSLKTKSHIKTIHEGQKDHISEFCEKLFVKAGTLKSCNKMVHNNQNCEICSKSFSTTVLLNHHGGSIVLLVHHIMAKCRNVQSRPFFHWI